MAIQREGNNAAGSLQVHYLIPFKAVRRLWLHVAPAWHVVLIPENIEPYCGGTAYRDVVTRDPRVSDRERERKKKQEEEIERKDNERETSFFNPL